MSRFHYFTTCGECGREGRNEKGICAECEVIHGYANDNRAPIAFSDDVDPASRPPLPMRVVEVGHE